MGRSTARPPRPLPVCGEEGRQVRQSWVLAPELSRAVGTRPRRAGEHVLRALRLEPPGAPRRRGARRPLRRAARRPSPSSSTRMPSVPCGSRRSTASAGCIPSSPEAPGLVHVEYPEEDIQALSWADESFDLVLTSETLEHVPDPPARCARRSGCSGPAGGTSSPFRSTARSRRRARGPGCRPSTTVAAAARSVSSRARPTCSCTPTSAATSATSSPPQGSSTTVAGGARPRRRRDTAGGRMSRRRIALITGVGGQDGSLLGRLLLDEGYEVAGVVRREPRRLRGGAGSARGARRARAGRSARPARRSSPRFAPPAQPRSTTSPRRPSCRARGTSRS